MSRDLSSAEAFNEQAAAYQERFMHLDIYNQSYDLLCSLLPADSEVLDAGCGPGNISRYLLSKRKDLRLSGFDLAPNMVNLAKANNPAASYHVLDIRDIGRLNKKFQAIACAFCIPYLSKQETNAFIGNCHSLLQHKGLLYLSFIAGDHARSAYQYSSDGKNKCFVYYYSQEEMEGLLMENKFTLLHHVRVAYPSRPDEIHVILIAARKASADTGV